MHKEKCIGSFFFYTYNNGNTFGFGSIDGHSKMKTMSMKGINNLESQIKEKFNYDKCVITGWQPIVGPRQI